MVRKLKLLIDGQWLDTQNARPVINPATGEPEAELSVARSEDLAAAAAAAAAAFEKWKRVSALERGNMLRKCAALMRERAAAIGELITRENGKTLAEATLEVQWAADYFDWFAEEARRVYGRVIPARMPGVRQMVLREPIGPSLGLSPWNWPVMTATRKLAPALAAGCTVILKPAEETPSGPVELVKLLVEAGVPAGAVNVVYGDPAHISSELIASKEIRKVSFTGSVPVGRHLAALAGQHLKRITLELGGHAPVLVFDDADVADAVAKLATFKFRTSGQVCSCPSRFFVQEGVYDEFVERFRQACARQVVGNGLDTQSTMGPLTSERRLHAVSAFVDNAVAQGAQLLHGGKRLGARGNFYAPTLLGDVPPQAQLMQEETFGPIVPVVRFQRYEEAIALANGLNLGLSAYAFTASLATAQRLSEDIQSGMVGINSMAVSIAEAPFGGIKDSGQGHEGGQEGLEGYLNTKFVSQAG
ncbi:NAD-dependent succinate-semialdehyde dehydrogenase [Pigmentiphaga soli]|uniref:NAD-dependent succinate-semialdehyde dehydrogenase n=1 Tax=Pigmentiphaga soli TaxID=1007095 RepID=A0ABP8H8P2_9BURK